MKNNFLVIGDDEFLKKREADALIEKYLPSAEARSADLSVHFPIDTQELLNSLRTSPFFSKVRVVLLKEAEKLDEASAEMITRYLAAPFETTAFVILASPEIKKTQFFKGFSDNSETITAGKPREADARKWVSAFFKSERIAASPDAIDSIVKLKGNDLAAIKTELEKLACYCSGGRLEKGMVEALVGRSADEPSYAVTNAIARNDTFLAMSAAVDSCEKSDDYIKLFGSLGKFFRRLKSAGKMMKSGMNDNEIIAALGINPGQLRYIKDEARKFSPQKIENSLNSLYSADREIKSGKKKEKTALVMLLSGLFPDR